MENKFQIVFNYVFTHILMFHNMIMLYFHWPNLHVWKSALFFTSYSCTLHLHWCSLDIFYEHKKCDHAMKWRYSTLPWLEYSMGTSLPHDMGHAVMGHRVSGFQKHSKWLNILYRRSQYQSRLLRPHCRQENPEEYGWNWSIIYQNKTRHPA